MTAAKTLLQLAGADLSLPRLGDACLVLIDLQNEYVAGPIALPDANAAIASAAKLLERARTGGASIFHIAHKGRPGGLFDRAAERGAIDADSCATRDLPDGRGGTIAAATIHEVALAELSDRFAIIARGANALV